MSNLDDEARALADYIFRLDAQYQGGILKAKNRDDFIDRCIVPVLAAHMIPLPSSASHLSMIDPPDGPGRFWEKILGRRL